MRVASVRVRRALRRSRPLRVRRPRAARKGRLVVRLAAPRGPCAFGSFSNQPWNVPCAGWRSYGARSPFNRGVPPAPQLAANSAGIVRRLLSWGNNAYAWGGTAGSAADWASATYYSEPSDPVFTIHCWRYSCPELEGRRIRIPQRAQPTQSVDAHMAIVDQRNRIEYDFHRAPKALPKGGGVIEVGGGGSTEIGTPTSDGRNGDSTAAGFGLLAGAIRPSELEAGKINHALITSVACTSGAVWPAAGRTGALCSDPTDAPKMGQHLRLAMSDAEIKDLPAPPWRKAILRAYARYGAFVGDTSGTNGNLGIALESTQSWLSFGLPDPWVRLGKRYDLPTWLDSRGVLRYLYDVRPGVDWAARLRVLDPCVSRGTC